MIFVKNSMGGQDDQHCVKNEFVKNRVGGREVKLNLYNSSCRTPKPSPCVIGLRWLPCKKEITGWLCEPKVQLLDKMYQDDDAH